jgi:ATP-dependent 26S proteasome regulatory subunit
VRREILDVLELPFKYPALFHAGCPRRQGVLLYGPPGKRFVGSGFVFIKEARTFTTAG